MLNSDDGNQNLFCGLSVAATPEGFHQNPSHPTILKRPSGRSPRGFFGDGGVTARHLRFKVSERNIPKYLNRERVAYPGQIRDPQSLGQQDGATLDKQYCIGENPVHHKITKASQEQSWGAFFYPYHNHTLFRHET